MLTASPTAPNPKTATVEPLGGFATLRVAPSPTEEKTNKKFKLESIILQVINRILIIGLDVSVPVDIPQLRTQTLSREAKGLILATQPA